MLEQKCLKIEKDKHKTKMKNPIAFHFVFCLAKEIRVYIASTLLPDFYYIPYLMGQIVSRALFQYI